MKKVLLALLALVCLNVSAQISFMGIPLGSTSHADFSKALEAKGYKFFADHNNSVAYDGKFSGVDATIMLDYSVDSVNVSTVAIWMTKLTPIKIGELYSQLLTGLMEKYKDAKYNTEVGSSGSTTTTFMLNDGWIALKLSNDYRKGSEITLIYSINAVPSPSSDGKGSGLGIDDL